MPKNENPTIMYKLCNNKDSNDFNKEPEKVEIPYQVWEIKEGKAFVNRVGWFGEKHRHWIDATGLHIK